MATKNDKLIDYAQAAGAQQTAAGQAQAAPVTAPVLGGSYDQQIQAALQGVQNRTPFSFSLDGDALYQQYRDRYTQNARRSMKDTMGQAASLTGGYGSTYGQAVGQQAYDETMRGLTDMIPELQQQAYARWQDEGDRALQNFNMLRQLGLDEQATNQWNQQWALTQQQHAEQQEQNQYQRLSQAILQSGYVPTEEELTASGMTQQQAEALRQAWIASSPNSAFMQGILSAEDYFRLTGQQAPGVVPAGGGGGGGGGGRSGSGTNALRAFIEANQAAGVSLHDIKNELMRNGNYSQFGVDESTVRALMEEYGLHTLSREEINQAMAPVRQAAQTVGQAASSPWGRALTGLVNAAPSVINAIRKK